MKKTLKKLLICILIVLILNNFFFNNISFAADDPFGEWLADMLGAVVGLLTWPVRMIALACAWAIDGVTTNIALLEGYVDENGNIVESNPYGADEFDTLTPFHILFNKIALLDVNFFNILDNGSVVSTIRNSIAGWYYVMRMIAAAILLCVLVYVGIRMAITTIASDKAAYKKMLVDWVCSLALIFVLQYIILFTFAVNEAFIKALSSVSNSTELVNAMQNIKVISKGISAASIAATIVFCMLTAQTLALLFSYFKRMLKIAFLIIIAPLITLTYSIDKMGDGKAQALNTWLKEFVYTVLLQTFHCIIYTVFVGMALTILQEGEITRLSQLLDVDQDSITIAGSILAIFCVKFTKDAEEILGKIFDFKGSTGDSSIGAGMLASAAVFKGAGNLGKGVKSTINGVRNLNLGGQMRNLKVAAIATKAAMFGAKNEKGERVHMDSNEALDYANTRVTEKEASKLEKKNKKGKYAVTTKDKGYQKQVTEVAKDLMKNSGMTKKLAFATARAQVARKAKNDKKESFYKHHKVIGGARGTIKHLSEAGKTFRKTETAKFLNDMGKATFAIGVGTFAGSAQYGLKGDMFSAITMGAGMMKGTQELLKTSTTTLKDNAHELFEGAGISNEAEAEREMNMVRALSPILGDNTELQRQLDELLKFVESALGGDKETANSAKTTIKNTVAKSIKENPRMTNEQLMSQVQNSLAGLVGKDGKKGILSEEQYSNITGHSGFNAGVSDVIQMQRRKELHDLMENGKQLGFNEDTFTRIVSSGYNNSSGTAFQTKYDAVTEIADRIATGEQTLDSEAMKKMPKEIIPEEREELQSRHDNIVEEMESMIPDDKTIDDLPQDKRKIFEQLEQEDKRILSAIGEMDKHIESEIKKKLVEQEKAFEDAKRTLEREATQEAQKKFDAEVVRIRQEVENYKREIEKTYGKDAQGIPLYSSTFNKTLELMKKETEE